MNCTLVGLIKTIKMHGTCINSVNTSKRTQPVSIRTISWLVLQVCKEIFTAYCENHREHINTVGGEVECFNVTLYSAEF
jgi:hypothetical protein